MRAITIRLGQVAVLAAILLGAVLDAVPAFAGVRSAAGPVETLTVTLGSDAAVVVTASDASGAPMNGLSLTMLARSDTGSIVGPQPLAADAGLPGRYATGPSVLPAGTWSVTVSEGGGARTTAVLTSPGPVAEAKPNPRHPQPTRTTAGRIALASSHANPILGASVVALIAGIAVTAIVLADRRRRRC